MTSLRPSSLSRLRSRWIPSVSASCALIVLPATFAAPEAAHSPSPARTSATHAASHGSSTPQARAEAEGPEHYEFFLDGQVITCERANERPAPHVLGIFGSPDDPSDRTLRLHFFSTPEAELAFAEESGIPLQICRETEHGLAELAESSGASSRHEATGELAPDDDEREAALISDGKERLHRYLTAHERSLPTDAAAGAGLLIGHYGKDYFGGSTWVFLGAGTNAFLFGWDKKISRYYVGLSAGLVYGWVAFYDRTFRRQRYFGMWNWTNTTVRFEAAAGLQWADNRASSSLIL
jgi:hypothetical protein